jgi:hypothetical protein
VKFEGPGLITQRRCRDGRAPSIFFLRAAEQQFQAGRGGWLSQESTRTMATPSSAIQRPDLGLALEEFDLEGSQEGFIGTKVFPVLPVQLKTANFSRIKLLSLLQTSDTNRAPGAAYSRGQGEFTQDNFACKEHGHEEVVDDAEKNIYAYTIDSEVIAAKRARDVVRRNLERRVAAQVFNTTTWTGAALTTAVGTGGARSRRPTPRPTSTRR